MPIRKVHKMHIVLATDDEISDVLQKIKNRREKRINILVPPRTAAFGHAINLKILQRKLHDGGKEVLFFTSDPLQVKGLKKARLSVEEEPTTPPEGRSGAKTDDTWWNRIRTTIAARTMRRGQASYLAIIRPNRKPVVAFGLLALIFVVGIVYITLPTATIHIKPILKIKKSTLNIEMATDAAAKAAGGTGREVGLRSVSTAFERTIRLTPSGRIATGNVARGKVTLINVGPNDFPIVGNTRVQTTEGLVFLTKNFVTVPAGSATKPGTTTVEVFARDKDANDVFIGSRGNIGPSAFFLPALSETSRKIVYAKNLEPFTGGTDAFEYFVTNEDINGAKEKIKKELEVAAVEELKKSLITGKDTGKIRIFERTEDLLKKNVELAEVRAQVNQKVNEFEARGRISVTGYAFDESQLEEILRANLITNQMSPTEKILKIKEGSLQINEILEKDGAKGRVKANVSLEAIVSYDFLNNNLDMVQQIRGAVVGKPRASAEKYINNLKDISKAWITVWPMWTPTLPTIPENIEIVIEEGEE